MRKGDKRGKGAADTSQQEVGGGGGREEKIKELRGGGGSREDEEDSGTVTKLPEASGLLMHDEHECVWVRRGSGGSINSWFSLSCLFEWDWTAS